MNEQFSNTICKATGASSFYEIEEIQTLWSGYGRIVRLGLVDSVYETVVVKQVDFGNVKNHPRGWNTDTSHQRKVKSYEVESSWYSNWSNRCGVDCRVPQCYTVEIFENKVLIVLEDLDGAGFSETMVEAGRAEIEACLSWLASFHVTFMNSAPFGLWEQGTYWHLKTRPDELNELSDLKLKQAASLIDEKLNSSRYKTIVHGDAKLANFCFTKDGSKAAAVDFQYVGGGSGVKDVAYFLGSCLAENQCESLVPVYLDYYFDKLKEKLENSQFEEELIIKEWKGLFPFAWADFHRFLKGWSPSHWKINDYSEKVTKGVVDSLLDS